MDRPAAKNRILVVLLILIGISEPLAFLADWPGVRAIGRISSASNCPLVFNQVGGMEFWASRYRFDFVDRDGQVSTLHVTREVLSRIRGSHVRTAAYVVPIGLGPLAGPALYRDPLRYGLCRNGPLARDLGHEGDLASATVHIESGAPDDPREWMISVSCAS